MRHYPRNGCACTALLPAIVCAFTPGCSRASDFELLSVGVRARFSEQQMLGKNQAESFREYDLVFANRLPWDKSIDSDWGMGARLLTSVGVLRSESGQSSLVASAIPVFTLARHDGQLTVELGAGLALLGQHAYARQDFGGALQFALTLGVAIPLYRRLGVGYRFMHYSDGGAYGREATGADMHMVEITYRF